MGNIAVLALTLTISQINTFFEDDDLPHRLAVTLSQATSSLDIAFHQFYHHEVIDSLISAYNRGVRIRIITEHDYVSYLQSLIDMGIPVIDEGFGVNDTQHRMHNKFIVIDYWDSDTSNDYVWTGSFNASYGLHADNAILIRSHALAELFEAEFNQMWGDTGLSPDPSASRFGTRKTDVLPTHYVLLSSMNLVEVYFSPQDNPIDRLAQLVHYADSLIDFCIYCYTSYDLRDAMIDGLGSGLTVRGVFDDQMYNYNRSVFNLLSQNNAQVYWDSLPENFYYLHHKFMVIDDSITVTGSMNWTYSGTTYNDENVVIIYSRTVSSQYENEFIQRFVEAGGSLVNLDDSISPEDRTASSKLKAFPMVFDSKVRFNLEGVRIYDATGKLVGRSDGFVFDGSSLADGVYFAVKGRQAVKIVKSRIR